MKSTQVKNIDAANSHPLPFFQRGNEHAAFSVPASRPFFNPVVTQSSPPQIARKVSAENPTDLIPDPGGTGLVQDNEITLLDYVDKLCPDTDWMVGGGKIDLLDDSFCKPDGKQAPGSGKSKADLSAHPVACSCLCEMVTSGKDIIIRFSNNPSDSETVDTPNGAIITVPSPNAPKDTIRGQSGGTIDVPPHTVLGHELCGHYWLEQHGLDDSEDMGNDRRGGHDAAIKRENLIRAEEGLEGRGTFRDPCCGYNASTAADLSKSSDRCGDRFEKLKKQKGTYQYECSHWRDEYNNLNGTHFTTDDAIPVAKDEKLPAQWRIELYFNIDAPQAWMGVAQSLTEDGKHNLATVITLLTRHPDWKLQISGNASSDKPAGDPGYNKRLADRRATLILKELEGKGIDDQRFQTFDSGCDKIKEGVHNCGDTVSEALSNDLDRNVEVKLYH